MTNAARRPPCTDVSAPTIAFCTAFASRSTTTRSNTVLLAMNRIVAAARLHSGVWGRLLEGRHLNFGPFESLLPDRGVEDLSLLHQNCRAVRQGDEIAFDERRLSRLAPVAAR